MKNEQEMMQNQEKTETEKKRRRLTDNIVVIWLIAFLMLVVGQILGSFLYLIPFMSGTDLGQTLALYLLFGGVWVVAFVYMRFTKKNRPVLETLGKELKGNRPGFFLAGAAAGVGLNGICVLAAWLHGDIVLYYDSFHPVYLLLIFAAVFVQSSLEEFICRGFVYQRLLKSYGKPWVAIVGSALLFALMHLMNDGVTWLSVLNIFVIGIAFALMVYYMESLWCAMALHTAWNFTQNIIFGLPNSGLVTPFSVFKLEAASARDSFAYNVGFGIEGTVFADAVLIAVCVFLFVWGRKCMKPERE